MLSDEAEGRTLVVTFWQSRELADRHLAARAGFATGSRPPSRYGSTTCPLRAPVRRPRLVVERDRGLGPTTPGGFRKSRERLPSAHGWNSGRRSAETRGEMYARAVDDAASRASASSAREECRGSLSARSPSRSRSVPPRCAVPRRAALPRRARRRRTRPRRRCAPLGSRRPARRRTRRVRDRRGARARGAGGDDGASEQTAPPRSGRWWQCTAKGTPGSRGSQARSRCSQPSSTT